MVEKFRNILNYSNTPGDGRKVSKYFEL